MLSLMYTLQTDVWIKANYTQEIKVHDMFSWVSLSSGLVQLWRVRVTKFLVKNEGSFARKLISHGMKNLV